MSRDWESFGCGLESEKVSLDSGWAGYSVKGLSWTRHAVSRSMPEF